MSTDGPAPIVRGSTSPRVLCVGTITLDHVYSVTTTITPGIKHRADGRRDVGGGIAANAAVAISRLGGRAVLFGAVGTDAVGDAVLAELRADDVDVDHVIREDATTTESVVLIEPDGARTIVAHAAIDLATLTGPAAPTDGVDAVLVDARWPAATSDALRAAHTLGAPAIVDVDRGPTDETERMTLLSYASHLVCSEVGLAELTGVDERDRALRELAARTSAHVSVTAGSEGVAWVEDGEIRRLAAFEVDVVDTTGAGDVFHGAFALAVAEGRDDHDAFAFASAVAAIKCSRAGARSGIPGRDEVEEFLSDRSR